MLVFSLREGLRESSSWCHLVEGKSISFFGYGIDLGNFVLLWKKTRPGKNKIASLVA